MNFAIPFAAEIRLIPNLVGLYFARIMLRESSDKCAIVGEVIGWATFVGCGACPIGGGSYGEENIESRAVKRINNTIERREIDLPFCRLEIAPIDGLLDP